VEVLFNKRVVLEYLVKLGIDVAVFKAGYRLIPPFFFFPSFFPLSVQDKDGVLDPTAIPVFIPEITIGGTEYDKIYYEYRSVSDTGRGAVV